MPDKKPEPVVEEKPPEEIEDDSAEVEKKKKKTGYIRSEVRSAVRDEFDEAEKRKAEPPKIESKEKVNIPVEDKPKPWWSWEWD